ncbi:MAG: HYC_CC_PP family protein [Chitinophagaceae bacterium]
MKKILVILLITVYAISSSGATLHFHYCCGKFDKIDFNANKKDNCPFANKISQKGCCDNRQVELKIKSDYQPETIAKTFYKVCEIYNNYATTYCSNIFINNNLKYFSGVSPPLSKSVPLYILQCVYRI